MFDLSCTDNLAIGIIRTVSTGSLALKDEGFLAIVKNGQNAAPVSLILGALVSPISRAIHTRKWLSRPSIIKRNGV